MRRLANAGLGDRAGILPCGLQELPQFLDALDHAEGFDGIVSNFGALNCVPSLDAAGRPRPPPSAPGGAVMLGLMGRTCAWETVYFTARGDALKAARRRQSNVAVPVAGVDVPTFYHRTPRRARRARPRTSRSTASIGIGVVIPPPYLEPRWQRCRPPFAAPRPASIALTAAWPPFNRSAITR